MRILPFLHQIRMGLAPTLTAGGAAVLLATAGCAHDDPRPSADPVVTQTQRETELSNVQRSNAENPLGGLVGALHR